MIRLTLLFHPGIAYLAMIALSVLVKQANP